MSWWLILLIAYCTIAYMVGIAVVYNNCVKDKEKFFWGNFGELIISPLVPLDAIYLLLYACIKDTRTFKKAEKKIARWKFNFKNLFRSYNPYRFPKLVTDEELHEEWGARESAKVNSYLGERGNIKFSSGCIYYIALQQNPIEEHIAKYADDINKLLKLSKKELVYIPQLLKNVSEDDIEYITGCDVPVKPATEYYKKVFCDEFKAIFDVPCFLTVGRYHGELCIKYVRITDCQSDDPVEIVKKCCYALSRREILYEPDYPIEEQGQILYRTVDSEEEELPPLQEEDLKAIEEIRHHLGLLREHGVDHEFLLSLLKEDVEKSRLTITSDYRIFLTDYGNKEVVMTKLAKAIYLLYLNHPEGIPLKLLVDYEDELCDLYYKINPGNIARMRITVNKLVDPGRNRMNEELSRIKRYFMAQISEHQADSYIIKGARGEARSISLDRTLVVWETK